MNEKSVIRTEALYNDFSLLANIKRTGCGEQFKFTVPCLFLPSIIRKMLISDTTVRYVPGRRYKRSFSFHARALHCIML